MRVMSAGDGYKYLLQSVAAGDDDRPLTTPLIAYYEASGTPPGYWLGTGVHGLGTNDRRIQPGGTVSEDHLRRLLGQGHDPVTNEPLGQAYSKFKTAEERISERAEHLDPNLPPIERSAAVERIEAEEHERGTRRVVAGYDYTFSVPKSVSALWAVADAAVQARIVAAHHEAVADVVALMERDVAATRVGHAGVAQVATRGLIATAYDHYDSRAADPQLHTHVVVSNKVQGEDGKWRALDGRPMHQAVVAISEHYNAVLADRMTRTLGVGWAQRERGRDRNPAWEIVGVPDELIAEFSSRSAAIDAETDRLIDTYLSDHGHRPDTRTILRLRQQATLSTRPDKTHGSLADLTDQWRSRADRVLGQDPRAWAGALIANRAHPSIVSAEDVSRDEFAALSQAVVEQVQEKRSTWGRWNLSAEASRQTMGLRFATVTDREAVIGLITDTAEAMSLRLTPPELVAAPAAFTRPEGSSVFRPRHAILYTSTALLAAEDRLLDLSRATTGPAIDQAGAAQVADSPDEQGRVLSSDQRSVVERIATSGRTVDVLVGPAGAGKTLALGGLRRAWEAERAPGSVIGLAPSAAAAEVLASDLEISTENTAKWLYEHDHGRWDLTAGQLVIVDEASLAGTMLLDQLATHAADVGAKVLLAGDPAQLAAVDAGGAFGLLFRDRNAHDDDGAPELADIRRFKNEWEKAASLALRRGDTDVIDLYDEHGRIIDGDHDDMLDAAYRAWQTDVAVGRSSILIAETSDTVTALNNRARVDRVLAGQVTVEGVALHDDTVAGRGDTIVTRDNDRRLTTGRGWVKNGDAWTVIESHEDGSLTVQRPGSRGRRGRVTLPAAYVAEHVELGYAITAHRAQGATMDTAHLVVHSSSMTREAFYVAMTRGRFSNVAYVATDEAHLEEHQHTPGYEDDVTARTILYGVLQHEGAEKSAHETIEVEQEKWSSIAQLAAEYETVAQAAQHQRFATAVGNSGLPDERARAVVGGESFGALIAQLRRTEAEGHQPEQLLSRAVRAGGLDDANDPAAVLAARLARLTAARAGGTRPRRRPRYIAGLIPEATGAMPADMHRTLTELQDLIEQRATALAGQAVQEGQAWVRRLGPPPTNPARRAAWQQQVRIVAAYRDRYGITGSDPLGPTPSGQGPRLDYQLADAAARRTQATGSDEARRRRGPEQQIDSGRGLSR
ncbi:conjugative relaxase-like TrwC/TraI family protein [Rudaeicoccus suwonensis]|uniref:Conjugative relaxase-like TrwC/TraI family protein n=2 Tax=Rudaeicoccus suwonensis TaxID=657409 RepID=A0A561EBS8_9MICO|nr:conjugative relaxase-like TrwC/TraI family protein [Rudaeicoccus suwonensis]